MFNETSGLIVKLQSIQASLDAARKRIETLETRLSYASVSERSEIELDLAFQRGLAQGCDRTLKAIFGG